jgi:hypothetical protein
MAMRNRVGVVLLALGLAVAAMLLALVGPLAAPAKTQVVVPQTLQGEALRAETTNMGEQVGEVSIESDVACTADTPGAGTIECVASGPATGPYPGTFTETGTFTVASGGEITSFSATFTIDSPIGASIEISGAKSAQNITGAVTCANNVLGAEFLTVEVPEDQVSYEASIVTPTSGTFTDQRTTTVGVQRIKGLGLGGGLLSDADIASFHEDFDSDLEQVLPTTKGQCKDGGYEQLAFVNEGDCVSFVTTGGKNQPK